MRLTDLIKQFPTSTEFEIHTGLSSSNYNNWKRTGHIPIKAQLKIEAILKGLLQASGDDMLADMREFKEKNSVMLDGFCAKITEINDPFYMRDLYFKQLQEAKQIIMMQTRTIARLEQELFNATVSRDKDMQ
jgi:hypothetical protein